MYARLIFHLLHLLKSIKSQKELTFYKDFNLPKQPTRENLLYNLFKKRAGCKMAKTYVFGLDSHVKFQETKFSLSFLE